MCVCVYILYNSYVAIGYYYLSLYQIACVDLCALITPHNKMNTAELSK